MQYGNKLKIAFHRYLPLIHDLACMLISLPIACLMRYGKEIVYFNHQYLLFGSLIFTGITSIFFYGFHLHRTLWKSVSIQDLQNIITASTLSFLIYSPIIMYITKGGSFPLSLIFIHYVLFLFLIAGSRMLYRLYRESEVKNVSPSSIQQAERVATFIFYDEKETEIFLRLHKHEKNSPYDVIGIITNDYKLKSKLIHRIPVVGDIEELDFILDTYASAYQKRILLLPSVRSNSLINVKELIEKSKFLSLDVARIDFFDNQGLFKLDNVYTKPISIEDYLGRPQRDLSKTDADQLISGNVIMVTGAGGSIGSELVKQIAQYNPKKIILFENNEYHLYNIDQEMKDLFNIQIKSILGDIRDKDSLVNILDSERPKFLFHAAALKHVPLVEENPSEAILTNVIGTKNVADACLKCGVKAMVQISTDKAVNPTSIMGASKRLAELYCQSLDNLHQDKTRFMTVRFGNVFGSSGSVVPLFEKQIQRGGPITITSPDMTRYFMSIKEAASLVLQAAVDGLKNCESAAQIYVLDMGEPIKIIDIAQQMIKLKKPRDQSDIEIIYTKVRPGEKLHEELFDLKNETVMRSESNGLFYALSQPQEFNELSKKIEALYQYAVKRHDKEVKKILKEAVHNFQTFS